MAMPVRVRVLVASLVVFGACKPVGDDSAVKVTNGADASSEHPEVVELRMPGSACTGTFVSDTTVITAAHCTTAGSMSVNGVQATRLLPNPNYRDGVGPDDLAVVIFPAGTGRSFAQIAQRPPRSGDTLTIVGFGYNDAVGRTGAGTKRKGTNTITSVSGGLIEFSGEAGSSSTTNALGQNSASASGDSGGPLFVEGRITGVTSGGGVHTDGKKYSSYVDLTSPGSMAHLRSAVQQGANIPGLDGAASGPTPPSPAPSVTPSVSPQPQPAPSVTPSVSPPPPRPPQPAPSVTPSVSPQPPSGGPATACSCLQDVQGNCFLVKGSTKIPVGRPAPSCAQQCVNQARANACIY